MGTQYLLISLLFSKRDLMLTPKEWEGNYAYF
jgi:hypothetical protein